MNKIKGLLILLSLSLQSPVLAYGYHKPIQQAIHKEQINIPNGLTIPIRFKYELQGDNLQAGDALAIEVIHDIYTNGILLFKTESTGYAKISSFKKSSFLGRGGKITINSGELIDIYGNKHFISFNQSTQGSSSVGPLVLTLLTSSIAVAAVPEILKKPKPSNVLFAAGLALSPLYFSSGKGKEANVQTGKVILAQHISPSVVYVSR